MKPPEPTPPLLRCADEYFRIFGNPFEGTKMLKSLALAIVVMLVGNVAIALLDAAGLMWLVVLLVMGGGLIGVWFYYGKPFPRELGQPGQTSGPSVSRASYFKTLPCPHCGKPVGATYSKNWVLHLRCVHCGGMAKTDCLLMNGGMISRA